MRPVSPDDIVKIRVVGKKESGTVRWQMKNQEEKMCVEGIAGIGIADWSKEIVVPKGNVKLSGKKRGTVEVMESSK